MAEAVEHKPDEVKSEPLATFAIAGIPLTLRRGRQPREYFLEADKPSVELGAIFQVIAETFYNALDCECGPIDAHTDYEKISQSAFRPVRGITIQGFAQPNTGVWEPSKGRHLDLHAQNIIMGGGYKEPHREVTVDPGLHRPEVNVERVRRIAEELAAKIPDRETLLKSLKMTEKRMAERADLVAYWERIHMWIDPMRHPAERPLGLSKKHEWEPPKVEKSQEFLIGGYMVTLEKFKGKLSLHLTCQGLSNDNLRFYRLLTYELWKQTGCKSLLEVVEQNGELNFFTRDIDHTVRNTPKTGLEIDFEHAAGWLKESMRQDDIIDAQPSPLHFIIPGSPGYSGKRVIAGSPEEKAPVRQPLTFEKVAEALADMAERFPWQNEMCRASNKAEDAIDALIDKHHDRQAPILRVRTLRAIEPYRDAVVAYLRSHNIRVDKTLTRAISAALQETHDQHEHQVFFGVVGVQLKKNPVREEKIKQLHQEVALSEIEPYATAAIKCLIERDIKLDSDQCTAMKQALAEAHLNRTPLQKLAAQRSSHLGVYSR